MRMNSHVKVKRKRKRKKKLIYSFFKRVRQFAPFKRKLGLIPKKEGLEYTKSLRSHWSVTGLLSESKRKILSKIFSYISLLLLVQIIFEILLLPFLCIRFVEVKGSTHLNEEELLSLAGIDGKEYYFSLEERVIAKKLMSFPWFRKAEVEKVFPNRLRISIEEREPVFLYLSKADEHSGSMPILLDEEGMAFASGRVALFYDLPVLSGVAVKGLGLKCQFPCFLCKLFEDMGTLKREHRFVYDLISEVYVQSKWGGESYELSLYLKATPIVFQLASCINIEKMTQVLLLLDLLDKNKESSRVARVDLRANEAVYCYEGE